MSADFQTKTLVQPRPSLIIIKPSLGYRFFLFAFGAGFGSFGVFAAYEMITDPRSEITHLWVPVIPLFIALLALLLFFGGGKYSFDRARKELTDTTLWFRRTRDLADIVRVQVSLGGEHSRGDGGGSYTSFRLAVVFKNSEEAPLLLADDAAYTWTCHAAATLARFLEVPMTNEAASTQIL